jgi:hypothetical protein
MENQDLRGRVAALEHASTAKEQRLLVVEAWQRQADIFNARQDVKFQQIELDLQGIKSILSRIMWLIVGGIGSGFVAFLLSGSMRLP